MLGVLVNRDVNKITSVFSALLLRIFWLRIDAITEHIHLHSCGGSRLSPIQLT